MNHEVLETTPEQLYADHRFAASAIDRFTADIKKSEEAFEDEKRYLHYPNLPKGTFKRLGYIEESRKNSVNRLNHWKEAYHDNLAEADKYFDPANQEAFWDEVVAADKTWQADQDTERLKNVPFIGAVLVKAFEPVKPRAIEDAQTLVTGAFLVSRDKNGDIIQDAGILMDKRGDTDTEVEVIFPEFGRFKFDSNGRAVKIHRGGVEKQLKNRQIRKIVRKLGKMSVPTYYHLGARPSGLNIPR